MEKLIEAVREGLERDGVLGKLHAEIRSEVLKLLGIYDLKKISKPDLSPEVKAINELIGEYLNWIGYSYTSAIFSYESNNVHSKDAASTHKEIIEALGLNGLNVCEDDPLPLLCNLINKVKQNCANKN